MLACASYTAIAIIHRTGRIVKCGTSLLPVVRTSNSEVEFSRIV
jgi:hypothetical protein